MTLYKHKYRIESARCPGWDYSSNGLYFVTICTSDRRCCLGDVVVGKMQLSPIGETVQKFWYEIPGRFSNVELDQFVVMPNHIHGIIMINPAIVNPLSRRDAINRVSTKRGGVTGENNPMLSTHALSKIVRWYKGRCKFEIGSTAPEFAWQSRFHDHIIRDDLKLNQIRTYILNNPENWQADCFHQ
jgi:REP element-mobilizing transposase RayT